MAFAALRGVSGKGPTAILAPVDITRQPNETLIARDAIGGFEPQQTLQTRRAKELGERRLSPRSVSFGVRPNERRYFEQGGGIRDVRASSPGRCNGADADRPSSRRRMGRQGCCRLYLRAGPAQGNSAAPARRRPALCTKAFRSLDPRMTWTGNFRGESGKRPCSEPSNLRGQGDGDNQGTGARSLKIIRTINSSIPRWEQLRNLMMLRGRERLDPQPKGCPLWAPVQKSLLVDRPTRINRAPR